MREVSDSFLLAVAELSASLVGLFLVGIFFYVETGLHRARGRSVFQPYLRAGTRITLIVSLSPSVFRSRWSFSNRSGCGCYF